MEQDRLGQESSLGWDSHTPLLARVLPLSVDKAFNLLQKVQEVGPYAGQQDRPLFSLFITPSPSRRDLGLLGGVWLWCQIHLLVCESGRLVSTPCKPTSLGKVVSLTQGDVSKIFGVRQA